MLKNFDFDKTPVVEIVNGILVDSAKRGASDIHFDPHEKFLKVRIRVDGELADYTEIPELVAKNLVTRIKIISGMNITESRLPQDGAIKATIEDLELDLRVSSLPTNLGEKIVIRLLDYSMSNAGLESLGFTDENYKKIMKMISAPNGIVLITGATGTGKSTTLYTMLQRLNKETTNIITVEDPIEMDIDGINQIQTNSEIGLDFATVLRSILRQDPNIIMIGEIRDTETAKIAVRASITGHLVLSTLHTNDSLNTLERLLDMGVERYLLASSLTGIVSQNLARKLCPHCKKLRPTNDYEKGIFKRVLGKDINEIYSAEGCDECSNGYHGRVAIHEVLLINQEIRDAISSNMPKEQLRRLVYSSDVISLLRDGIDKVIAGETTLEELLKIIELDDDNGGSTGLQNAIKSTEITQENENTMSNSNNSINNTVETTTPTITTNIETINQNNNISQNQSLDLIDNDLFAGTINNNESNIVSTPENDSKKETINTETSIPITEEIPVNKSTETEEKNSLKDSIITNAEQPKEEAKKTTSLHKNLFSSKKNIFK